MQETVYVKKVTLDIDVTSVRLGTGGIRIVNRAHVVELVVLILTHVKVIVLVRYDATTYNNLGFIFYPKDRIFGHSDHKTVDQIWYRVGRDGER